MVTKRQIGLGRVINCRQLCKTDRGSCWSPCAVAPLVRCKVPKRYLPCELFKCFQETHVGPLSNGQTWDIDHSACPDPNCKRLVQLYKSETACNLDLDYEDEDEGHYDFNPDNVEFMDDCAQLKKVPKLDGALNCWLYEDESGQLTVADDCGDPVHNGKISGSGATLLKDNAFQVGKVCNCFNFNTAPSNPSSHIALGPK